MVTRPSADVLRDAEQRPDGYVTIVWLGNMPLFLSAQWALQAGRPGIEQAQRELLGQMRGRPGD